MSNKENKRKFLFKKRRPGGGRKRISEQHPELVASTEDYIRQNGFAADNRRRTTTGQACGTTLPNIKSYLEEVHQHQVSTSTIHRWMNPPRKDTHTSAYYSSLIDARVACKKNDVRDPHIDDHYQSSRVRYRLELHAQFGDEICAMSCDNKNKVKIGTQAVSRYFKVAKFFIREDSPNYADHDFPLPGYLITPCGYMQLNLKDAGKLVNDESGRQHMAYARTGESFVVNRGPWNKMTIQEHVNDLGEILPNIIGDRKALILVVDGGPDWGYKGYATICFYMRLWRDLDLDMLTVTMYAPGSSAYNPIEHLWSPLSKKLASVKLPAVLPGETVPPCQQRQQPAEVTLNKEKKVINNAMERLTEGYWSGMHFDGYDINVSYVKADANDGKYSDYERVHTLLNGSARELSRAENRDILNELRFAVKHTQRHTGEVTFVKCTDNNCGHCSTRPVTALKTVSFIRGYGIGHPVEDIANPGHYMTFLQQSTIPDADEIYCPSDIDKGLGKCESCPCYVFSSKADQTRHRRYVHRIKV